MSAAHGVDLYDFLNDIGLISYLQPMRLQLGVESFEQLKYVKKEDLQGIGMPAPIRRQFLEEYRKKAGYTKIPLINKRVKMRPPSLKGFNGTKTENGMLLEGPGHLRNGSMPSDCSINPSDAKTESQLCSTNEQPFVICDTDLKMLEHIGQGHFATVYKATLRLNHTETTVAVKELKPGSTSGPLKDLTKEARVMMAVRHKNIIHFYGIVLGDGSRSPYNASIRLVFEYANGGSLDSYLKNKKPRLTVYVQWLYCQQILSGLAFLHERRLLHRDIAARNILVFNQELVKLADFGLSKLLPDVDESYTAETAIMPVAWSAPESLKFKRYSAYSDVYMFGVTCWEIFSFGDHPYPRLTANEMLNKLERGQTLTCPSHCPDNVYSLLLTCCAMAAADRPDTQSLVCQWSKVYPKMETTVTSCSVAGRLNFEKGDQLYIISTRNDESGGLVVKAQNKRTFAVGETYSSNLASTCSSSSCKVNSTSASSSPTAATKNMGPKSPIMKENELLPSATAKSVLMHVPRRNLSPDEPSAWDYELYGEGSNNAHTTRSTLVSEPRTKNNSTSLEHTGDLIDLSTLKPQAEHFSPDTNSSDPLGFLVESDNTFGATATSHTEAGDNCSIYDEQSEFYSVVDSDEDRRTPTELDDVNNYNPFADMTSASTSVQYSTTSHLNNPVNTGGNASSVFLARDTSPPPVYESLQSNWAPISVQEDSDSPFDKLPNVQYSVYSGAVGTASRPSESFRRGGSRSFDVVEHNEVPNQGSKRPENTLVPDLIDLTTLKAPSRDPIAGDLESWQMSSKYTLAKGMEMSGSRYSVDLESVLSEKSRKPDTVAGQTDFIDEMEQRIKKLREVQLSSSFRSKRLTEQKYEVQSSASAIKPQSFQANSNVMNANVQLSSLSRSVDISAVDFDPLHTTSSSDKSSFSAAATTANVFTCSTVGRRKGEQSTLTSSKNVQRPPNCQKSLPRSSIKCNGAAESAKLTVSSQRKPEASFPMTRKPEVNGASNFSAPKMPGVSENLPTAPPYEMLSNNTLKFVGDSSNAIVERMCAKLEVATTEQCYNALVEASWNEGKAEQILKVQILQNMCSLTVDNCKLILSNFKYDLTKASLFVQELEMKNSNGAKQE